MSVCTHPENSILLVHVYLLIYFLLYSVVCLSVYLLLPRPDKARRGGTSERANGRREASHVPPRAFTPPMHLGLPTSSMGWIGMLLDIWVWVFSCRQCCHAIHCNGLPERDMDVPDFLDGPSDEETPGGFGSKHGQGRLDLSFPQSTLPFSSTAFIRPRQ
jgi:hypothetical protein